jgi:hypothetical protein
LSAGPEVVNQGQKGARRKGPLVHLVLLARCVQLEGEDGCNQGELQYLGLLTGCVQLRGSCWKRYGRVETVGRDYVALYPVFLLFSISFSPMFDGSFSFPFLFLLFCPRGTVYIKTDARPPASNNQASSPLSTSSSNRSGAEQTGISGIAARCFHRRRMAVGGVERGTSSHSVGFRFPFGLKLCL